ncbi:hypothetical protein Y1Q_0021987 [Alligator mississippiensis]|uniref:Uncharacterized protein n=1 Tax=Alligator mississippiensis TaxID=8496 RepID=A0A151NLY2_ALLMI|nr:hypothetical protein Y1Q_0021987 [Alligator mississippiensis]
MHLIQDWWLHIIHYTWVDKQWLDSFCMTQDTFWNLLQHLWPHLERQDADLHLALPADTWLALTLLKLTTLASLCYIGHLFGVGKATAREAVLEVYGMFQDMLGHTVLHVHDLLAVVAHLHSRYGTMSYNSAGGKPGLPNNLCHCLEGYLWLCYVSLPPTAKEDNTTSIDAFLGM